jgi:hypothetical protein
VRRVFPCDRNRLRLLLEDGLPAPVQAEVIGHLDHCPDCQDVLENLAADAHWWSDVRRLRQSEKRNSAPITSDETGNDDVAFDLPADFLDPPENAEELGRLGPFAVQNILGRGGMGIVLKALDTSLNRPAAIKVLAPHYASSGAARKRFAREAQAAAAVVHEHVVAIHSVDSWKGLPYLVMSYVSGQSLQERLDAQGPLEVKEIARIGMQIAAGLAAAHAQGLVHRDVKPANILLENGVERVKITDFGLARAVDDGSLTRSGVIAGTPHYMAPEQARGETCSHRADLFSLGSTLYAMCTGRPPFRADSSLAVLRRVCEDQPRPVREVNPDVPEWLAAIIDKMHAKNPAERFASAAEVADLLGRCLAHMQQPHHHPLPALCSSRRSKKWRSRLTVLGAGAVLIAALLAAAMNWRPGSGDDAAGRQAGTVDMAIQQKTDAFEEGAGLDAGRLSEQARILDIELRQNAAIKVDPVAGLLEDLRQRMEALEKELR